MVLRPDPSLCLGALRKAGESKKLGVGKAKDASSTWTASKQPAPSVSAAGDVQRSQGCGFPYHSLPSIPAWTQSFPYPAWQQYMDTGAAGEWEFFWSRHPPNPSFPSFISLAIWHCSRGLQNTFPRESLKGLIIVWDSLLIVLISSFHSCVPVATGSPCECLVIPTDTGTWCCLKREGAAKLPPEIPLLLPLLHHPAQARIGTKRVSLSVHGGGGIK